MEFWQAIGILSAACGGGFATLLTLCLKNRSVLNELKTMISSRPTFKDVADEFYKKEVAELKFQILENAISEIKSDFKEIKEYLKKIVGDK